MSNTPAENVASMTEYRRADTFVYRYSLGEHLLVDTDTTKPEPMFALTETGARLWAALAEWRTVSALGSVLTGEFDVSAEQAAADSAEFLEHLDSIGALHTRGEA